MRKLIVFLAAITTVGLFALDPYAYGRIGGDILVRYYPWQTWGMGILAVLVLLAAALYMKQRKRLAGIVATVEAAGFAGINAFLIARDGVSRFVVGYESSSLPLITIVAGAALRATILARYMERSQDTGNHNSRQ